MNFAPSTPPPTKGGLSATPPATTFYVGRQTIAPGQVVSLPIVVTNFQRVTSVQFTLGWDPAVVQFLSVSDYGLPSLSGGNFNNQLNGKLALSWEDPTTMGVTMNNGAVIFTVQFQAVGSNGAVSAVSFEDVPTPRELAVDLEVTPADWRNGTVEIENIQPRCVSIQAEAGDTFRILFEGAPGKTYTIQYADSLSQPNWQPLGTRTADPQGFFEYVDTPPSDSPSRFYRAAYP
jgi:hypothetical protein